MMQLWYSHSTLLWESIAPFGRELRAAGVDDLQQVLAAALCCGSSGSSQSSAFHEGMPGGGGACSPSIPNRCRTASLRALSATSMVVSSTNRARAPECSRM